MADQNLWAPFEDGSSFAQWDDDARTQGDLERLGVSDADIKGYWAYEEIFDEMRKRLRTGGSDSWIGASPSRAELEMLGGDRTMIDILFDASIADVLESYVSDRRLPERATGRASSAPTRGPTRLGHRLGEAHALPGRSAGSGTRVGLRRGRHGPHQLRHRRGGRDLGAVLAAGVPVWRSSRRGVRLEAATSSRAKVVVSNADPKRALGMLARRRAGPVPRRDPVAGREVQRRARSPPTFTAAPGESWPYRSMITVTHRMDAAQVAFDRCQAGEPAVGFGEVYFQTGYDRPRHQRAST